MYLLSPDGGPGSRVTTVSDFALPVSSSHNYTESLPIASNKPGETRQRGMRGLIVTFPPVSA